MKNNLLKYIGAAVLLVSLQVGAYPSSSTDICFNSLADRSLWTYKIVKLSELNSGKLTVKDKQKMLEDHFSEHMNSDWVDALMPVLLTQYGLKKKKYFEVWDGYVKEPRSNAVAEVSCLVNTAELPELSFEKKAMLTLSCGQLAITDAVSCEKGVSLLYKAVSPSRDCTLNSITFPKIWAEIIGNSKYFNGIYNAAASIGSQMEDGKIVDENLLQTLKKGFLRSRFSEMEASEASWKVISIIANGAQNSELRLRRLIDNRTLEWSFNFLSRAMGIIDFEAFPLKTSSFSFPKEVTGHCQTTKPYHFWMAAYEARELIKQGFSQRAAMMAVLTFAKAYQTQSQGLSERSGLALIFQMPYDHPTLSVIRHDLILNVLGAAYGAGMLEGKHVNIETVFSKVFAARPKVGDLDYEKEAIPLAKDQIAAFRFWEKMFDPNGIFKIVEQEIRNAK